MERNYVGKGKVVGKFGNIRIGLKPSELVPNEKGWVNLIVSQMKETDKYGNTHTVYVDDFIPSTKQDDPF